MAVRLMIGNKIKNYFEAAPMRFMQKGAEIGKRAEYRINIALVRDVVTEVRHRRGIDR